MTHFEKTFGARDPYGPSRAGLPIARTIKSAALLALLFAYAMGFVIIYPVTQASVLKSAAEGDDATVLELVSP